MNDTVLTFLRKCGIVLELSNPGVPAQNGTSERSNRTVMDGARTLLLASRLTPSYWFWAVKHYIYILNRRSTTRSIVTPYARFYSREPTVTHLKIFGALGYVRPPQTQVNEVFQAGESRYFPWVCSKPTRVHSFLSRRSNCARCSYSQVRRTTVIECQC